MVDELCANFNRTRNRPQSSNVYPDVTYVISSAKPGSGAGSQTDAPAKPAPGSEFSSPSNRCPAKGS